MTLISTVSVAIALVLHTPASPETTVRSAYDAFNARDAEAFVSHVSEDVRWMSVSGESVRTETSGRDALRTYLARYFRSVPTVQSRIESLIVASSFVAVHERVTWRSASGEKTQSALAVYQVNDGRIVAVWYHDVVK